MGEWISDEEMDAIGDGLSEIYQARHWAELEAQEPGDWLCPCGHYQEDGNHCSECGLEPPWGCDCGEHDERDDYGSFYEYDGPPPPPEAYQEQEKG